MRYATPAKASCECGAVQINMHGALARMFCHCTICQRLNNAPFGEPVFLWRWHVEVNDRTQLKWKRHRWLPIHLNRGTCRTCETLILEYVAASPWAVVIGSTWEKPELMPPARGHIFYDTRVADIDDDLPKRSGYISSQLSIPWWVLSGVDNR